MAISTIRSEARLIPVVSRSITARGLVNCNMNLYGLCNNFLCKCSNIRSIRTDRMEKKRLRFFLLIRANKNGTIPMPDPSDFAEKEYISELEEFSYLFDFHY